MLLYVYAIYCSIVNEWTIKVSVKYTYILVSVLCIYVEDRIYARTMWYVKNFMKPRHAIIFLHTMQKLSFCIKKKKVYSHGEKSWKIYEHRGIVGQHFVII